MAAGCLVGRSSVIQLVGRLLQSEQDQRERWNDEQLKQKYRTMYVAK